MDNRFVSEIRWGPSKLDGQPCRVLDTSCAEERFRFVARTSFEERLLQTIEWYEVAKHLARDAARSW